MAVTNLSNQHISASYQNLMQISSSNALYNGTGSLIPNLAVTASFALSASYFQGNSVSASYVKLAQSASYVLLAKSSSFAFTASYNSGNSLSASYAVTASYAQLATNAQTASFNLNSVSASYAATASQAPLYLPLAGGTISGNLNVNGNVGITGSLTVTSSAATLGQFTGNQNGFVEFSVRNTSTGISASGDIAIYADTGTTSNNYIDIGINNSGMTSSYSYFGTDFGNALDAYVYNVGGNLRMGNATSLTPFSQSFYLFSNPTATPNIWITGSQVAINKQTGSINGSFDVNGNTVISGSLIVTGSNTLIGNKIVTGSVFILGANTITGSVFISGSKTVIGANTITGSLSVSGSITSTSGFIKSGSGSQILLADGTTSTNGTLFKTGSVAYAAAASTQTIVSSALTTSQFADYDTIQLTSIINTPIDAVAIVLIEVYVNGSPNMTGSPVKLATYNGPAANRYWWFDRTFWIQGGNINVRAANSSNSTSVGTFGSALSAVSLPSPTFYLILQITTTSTDTARASLLSIQKI